ncbi:poly-gamma-glutamate biosynthesis protein [Aquaspirillum sp. LM1]|uniref:CapA family protein n=1 Tax=Aquaspirillum sp. LM1 TaxID=1938604 RepID=UPI000983D581|nr:CapA family protein [Aquaspirillum sp. LM1]AQR65174.1 poly-gamma-glutamate biosynthesis protein [Aquaspirillum sp. LM1]
MTRLLHGLLLAAFGLSVALAQADAGQVRLLMVGDIMLDDGPGQVIASGRDPFAPFASLLADGDYTIGNLECPVATTGKALDSKIYTFRAHPRVLPVLKRHIDAVALANNHSGDYGKAAFAETLALLKQQQLPYFGGGANLREAHAPLWLEKSGLRVALLSYNEFKPRSFEAGASQPGIAWSEDAQVVADIRAARAAGADVVIPFMHWGWERETTPSARQRQLARTLIDAGADAVVGGHPHVTQGAETYRGKPIIYSLGNFVFDGFERPAEKRGWLLRLTLNKRGVHTWDTVAADMDAEGIPHPVAVATPCGKAGDATVGSCQRWPVPAH